MDRENALKKATVANSPMVADIQSRGWLLDVLSCVEAIQGTTFSLSEAYAFEDRLAQLHPDNHNIRAKIRQQLQVLRDRGVIEFVGRGIYKKN